MGSTIKKYHVRVASSTECKYVRWMQTAEYSKKGLLCTIGQKKSEQLKTARGVFFSILRGVLARVDAHCRANGLS